MDDDYVSSDEDEAPVVPVADSEDEEDVETVDTNTIQPSNNASYYYVTPADQMLTSDVLTGNAIAGVLAFRSEQIANNGKVILPEGVAPKYHTPERLAIQELLAGMCPLIIQIKMGTVDGKMRVERRAVRDMLIDIKSLESVMSQDELQALCVRADT